MEYSSDEGGNQLIESQTSGMLRPLRTKDLF